MSEDLYDIKFICLDKARKWAKYKIIFNGDPDRSHVPNHWVIGKVKLDKSKIWSASFKKEFDVEYDDVRNAYYFYDHSFKRYRIVDKVMAMVDYVILEKFLLGGLDGKSTRRKQKIIKNSR